MARTEAFVSVIVPVRNLGATAPDVVSSLDSAVRASFNHYEIVLVDDASTDETVDRILELQRTTANLQLYCLNRRSGLNVALTAGLDNCIGDFAITFNHESDPLDLIAALWAKSQQGYDAVCGVRDNGAKSFALSAVNKGFYIAFRASTGLELPIYLSDARVYSRRVITYITRNNDRHLLLKVLPFFTSYRLALITYSPLSRGVQFSGSSLAGAILNGLTILLASSVRPLRLLTLFAVTASFFSLMFAVYVLGVALLRRDVVEGWISLAFPMAVMFFFVSVILGALSEYMYMLAQQSGNRPIYSVTRESTSSVLEIREKLNVVSPEERVGN